MAPSKPFKIELGDYERPYVLRERGTRTNYAPNLEPVDLEPELEATGETNGAKGEVKNKKRKRKDEDSNQATRSTTSKAKKPRTAQVTTAKSKAGSVPKKRAQATTQRSSQANAGPSTRTAAGGGNKGVKSQKTTGSSASRKNSKSTSKPPRQLEQIVSNTKDDSEAVDSSVSQDAEISADKGQSSNQAEAQAPPAHRVNDGEYRPQTNAGISGNTHADIANISRLEASSADSLTLDAPPTEQGPSSMSLDSAMTDTAMLETVPSGSDSELSDVPEDIDMSAPTASTSTAFNPTKAQAGHRDHPQALDRGLKSLSTALTGVELLSSISTPPSSDRTLRVRTASKTSAELDSNEAHEEEGTLLGGQNTVGDERFEPTPTAPKKQTKKPDTQAARRKREAHPKPIESNESLKKRGLWVTLEISKGGLQRLASSIPSPNNDESLVTPKKPLAKISGHSQSGLLTPPDSRRGRDRQSTPEDLSMVDPDLIKLSEKLTNRLPMSDKPAAVGAPEVWADSRQALCETVPYFKMPQSGCHQNDRHVYSFLFDNVGHCREYMDTDVIISRAGGSMEADSTGNMVQKQDHVMTDAQVLAVNNDIALRNPLIIICGQKHEGAICKLPHRYNVMGWYKPVAVWAEKTAGKGKKSYVTIKYRFERLDEKKQPWHASGMPLCSDDEKGTAGPLYSQKCQYCQHTYPQVYLQDWMCLNPACDEFWKWKSNGRAAPCGELHYNPAFLLHRTSWEDMEEEPYTVKPPVPEVGKSVGDDLTYINTRGICCPECGRCSSRRFFKGWKCENPDCNYENFPTHMPVKVPMLHTPMDNTGDGPGLARNKHADRVKVDVSYSYGFKVYRYTVDGVAGSFVHLVSNAKINRVKGGADEMFDAIQNQCDPAMDLHLERRRFSVEKMGGNKSQEKQASSSAPAMADVTQTERARQEDAAEFPTTKPPSTTPERDAAATRGPEVAQDGDFMTAFSMNYGMPYKFVASGASRPFADSPWPVRAVRADLNWASEAVLGTEGHEEFNEELIFAYLQGQKIEYHDDGEEGLGPRIGTMSLGGKATMSLRMKMKHYTGCSKTGILTAEKPIPGGIDGEGYKKRLEEWNKLQSLKDSDKALYDKRRKELPRELGLYDKRNKKAADLVTVTLNHGDIILMEGYDIQRYLEHKVVPEGCLRFALTCRVVQPGHLKPEEMPEYGQESDEPSSSALRMMANAKKGEVGGGEI